MTPPPMPMPAPAPAYETPVYEPPPMMMARPMPPPVTRDYLDETIVKPIARPVTAKPADPPPQEDPLSPATEARAAKTAVIRRRPGRLQETVQRVSRKLVSDYKELSTMKRLLIPITIILFFAAAPSSSRANEAPTKHAPAPVATVAPKPAPAPLPEVAPTGVLPSARALAPSSQTPLSPEERRQYDRAINATLAGDFEAAEDIYKRLSVAHPDSSELSAAARVMAAKKKRKSGR